MKLADYPYCRLLRGDAIVILTEPGNKALVVMPEGHIEIRSLQGVGGHHELSLVSLPPKQRKTVESLKGFLW